MTLAAPALAARPLATDDAATVGERLCQIETWVEKAKDARGWVVAPACGSSESTEGGIEFASSKSHDQTAYGAALVVKWVPKDLESGGWGFGLKGFAGYGRVRPERWSRSETGAFGIASRSFGDAWTLHLNLGAARVHAEQRTLALAKAAAVWQATDRLLLFAELEAMRDTPTTQSAGLRWWLLPGRLGLDVTASRDVGVSDSRRYGVGLGWYGVFGD